MQCVLLLLTLSLFLAAFPPAQWLPHVSKVAFSQPLSLAGFAPSHLDPSRWVWTGHSGSMAPLFALRGRSPKTDAELGCPRGQLEAQDHRGTGPLSRCTASQKNSPLGGLSQEQSPPPRALPSFSGKRSALSMKHLCHEEGVWPPGTWGPAHDAGRPGSITSRPTVRIQGAGRVLSHQ